MNHSVAASTLRRPLSILHTASPIPSARGYSAHRSLPCPRPQTTSGDRFSYRDTIPASPPHDRHVLVSTLTGGLETGSTSTVEALSSSDGLGTAQSSRFPRHRLTPSRVPRPHEPMSFHQMLQQQREQRVERARAWQRTAEQVVDVHRPVIHCPQNAAVRFSLPSQSRSIGNDQLRSIDHGGPDRDQDAYSTRDGRCEPSRTELGAARAGRSKPQQRRQLVDPSSSDDE